VSLLVVHRAPPKSPLFPYTTLFRSCISQCLPWRWVTPGRLSVKVLVSFLFSCRVTRQIFQVVAGLALNPLHILLRDRYAHAPEPGLGLAQAADEAVYVLRAGSGNVGCIPVIRPVRQVARLWVSHRLPHPAVRHKNRFP